MIDGPNHLLHYTYCHLYSLPSRYSQLLLSTLKAHWPQLHAWYIDGIEQQLEQERVGTSHLASLQVAARASLGANDIRFLMLSILRRVILLDPEVGTFCLFN